MRRLLFRAPLLLLVLFIVADAHGNVFECAFLQEKFSTGRPNEATCSMFPEAVFSDKFHTPSKTAHCNVQQVYTYTDLTDAVVDIDAGIVKWTEHFGLTEEARVGLRARYIAEGKSEREADDLVSSERRDLEYLQIVSQVVTNTEIRLDPIKQEMIATPRTIPEYNLTLSGNNQVYFLFIPAANGEAILSKPTTSVDGVHSWVNVRFGKCREVQRGATAAPTNTSGRQ